MGLITTILFGQILKNPHSLKLWGSKSENIEFPQEPKKSHLCLPFFVLLLFLGSCLNPQNPIDIP